MFLDRAGSHQRPYLLAGGLLLILGCDPADVSGPEADPVSVVSPPSFDFSLSTYFPPSETNGGWRKTTSATTTQSFGMDSTGLAAFGAYNMSLPWEPHATGVSGYKASNKAALVIKNGWIVGEYYNQASARTAVYFLASNSKTFAMMLMGQMLLAYPSFGLTSRSRLYDQRWLPEGFPLTDDRKADITFDDVFRHVSGIIPEVQAKIASRAVVDDPDWNFAPFTVGYDADHPVSARLYFAPGQPTAYTKGDTYSSVAFNHLSLVFRNVTGLEPSLYFRRALLDPIGVGRMAYVLPQGMGDYAWATAGNALASARDYARLAYLLLHEGDWAGTRIFASSWIRQFTTVAGYPNISSNANCLWGNQYPKDMYRIMGSGINVAFVVPSLDLIATLNGRTPNSMKDQVARTFLEKLFAAVTQPYETCDGRIVNGGPPPALEPASAITLQVTGRSDATKQYMMLTWSGVKGTTVDIYRNGTFRTNTPNDGRQTNSRVFQSPATYIFKICQAGTYVCSNPASVQFGGGSPPPNKSPVAVFATSCIDQSCTFTDGSVDLDGTLSSWQWNFGDGSTSAIQSAAHNYAAGGTYTVSLTVTDNLGARKSSSQQVAVAGPPPPAPNAPPDAAFTPSCGDLTCSFSDASTDGDGTLAAWSWDFGDGSTSTNPNPSHTYSAEGQYQVTLTVTDNDEATGSVAHTVTVTVPPPPPPDNTPPTAAFTSSCSDLTCSFSDASTDGDGTLTAWSWDFGDGSNSTTPNPGHTYAASGAYTVTLVVTDDRNATGTSSNQVTVEAAPATP